ncbi:indole-3-glycerol phosphate synthase TrpC [Faucicola mancuniensis]|uniref:indole-3-glycerol phosphate synthase TrpC n=1 Tax=Faucicola mancuniensis TaxID=1309795 RepID=UPI0028E50B45|nr:indole-3-glycerol phosphate synthase TrpC [uncultured Moraxella sp.]
MTHEVPSVLKKIVETKKQELIKAKQQQSFYDLEQIALSKKDDIRDFAGSLRKEGIRVIAEVKKASPSKGIIAQNFDPIATAKGYEQAGASCLSVLTDVDYFQGSNEYLLQAREAVSLPLLRKDFMIEPYHIMQSRALGADCILLIMACLSDAQVAELHELALNLGMSVLIECHDKTEVERALRLPKHTQNIYGINNRNLNNFETSLNTTLKLREMFDKSCLLVTESGIHSSDDVKLMLEHDIHAFLIGEQFMKTENAGQALAKLLADSQ